MKGQWHIIGTEFGEKKGTITGDTLDKTKYELKGRESIDTLCGGNVPKEGNNIWKLWDQPKNKL